jgi:hypothetical protein
MLGRISGPAIGGVTGWRKPSYWQASQFIPFTTYYYDYMNKDIWKSETYIAHGGDDKLMSNCFWKA